MLSVPNSRKQRGHRQAVVLWGGLGTGPEVDGLDSVVEPNGLPESDRGFLILLQPRGQ